MNKLMSQLHTNLLNVSRLSMFPTHRLRVFHHDSILPSVEHDGRQVLQSVQRAIAGDGRGQVIGAVSVTFTYIEDLLEKGGTELVRPFTLRIKELGKEVRDGLGALKKSYAEDIATGVELDKLITRWETIINSSKHF